MAEERDPQPAAGANEPSAGSDAPEAGASGTGAEAGAAAAAATTTTTTEETEDRFLPAGHWAQLAEEQVRLDERK